MTEVLQFSLREFVSSNNSFGPSDVTTIARAICDDYSQFPVLRDLTAEMEVHTTRTPASSVRLGVCQYLLGRYRIAAETLANADGSVLNQHAGPVTTETPAVWLQQKSSD